MLRKIFSELFGGNWSQTRWSPCRRLLTCRGKRNPCLCCADAVHHINFRIPVAVGDESTPVSVRRPRRLIVSTYGCQLPCTHPVRIDNNNLWPVSPCGVESDLRTVRSPDCTPVVGCCRLSPSTAVRVHHPEVATTRARPTENDFA